MKKFLRGTVLASFILNTACLNQVTDIKGGSAHSKAPTNSLQATSTVVSADEAVIWTDQINVLESPAGTLKKNGGTEGTWNQSGAESRQIIPDPGGFVEFTINEAQSSYTSVGMGPPTTPQYWISGWYNIQFDHGNMWIQEHDMPHCSSTYKSGDRIRMTFMGNSVNVKKNGADVCTYTPYIPDKYPLAFHVMFPSYWSSIQDARIGYFGDPNALKVDLATYPMDQTPQPSARGQIVRDASFYTRIMRITDSSDGSDCRNAYSYYQTLNRSNNKILAFCDNLPYIINFDPNTLSLGTKYPALPNGPRLDIGTDMTWSDTNPDVLFFEAGQSLWYRNVVTGEQARIHDFTNELGTRLVWQQTKSADDDIFAFSKAIALENYNGFVVYSKKQNRVLLNLDFTPLDEVHIDKSGRYLQIFAVATGQTSQLKVGDVIEYIVDMQPYIDGTLSSTTYPQMTPIHILESEKAIGHGDMGTAIMVGIDSGWNDLNSRYLFSPQAILSPEVMFSFGSDWSRAFHISMLADNERWSLNSTYDAYGTSVTSFLQNEIFQVATDGSGKVRRIAHHQSYLNNYSYWDMPRANINRDGRFVFFTSNWRNTKRDLYMAIIPPAP